MTALRRTGIARARLGCLLAVAVLASAGICAPTAVAAGSGGSAFDELATGGKETPKATTTTPAKTRSTTKKESEASTSTSSNTSGILLFGLIAAGALLGGIAFLILRDARRVAPVPDGQLTARPARDVAAMMRKRRAKAKAARRQRRRNR